MSPFSSWWTDAVADLQRVHLHIDADRRLGTLEFARPAALNAIDWQFVEELDEASTQLEDADRAGVVDVVLIRSQGRHFCVGGDLNEFPPDPADATAHIRAMATIAHRGTLRLAGLKVPIVARIQGAAAGAGVGFALLADFPIASDRASFTLAYAAVGLVPDGGVSWLLPRRVGERRALELLLTNRRLTANESLDMGLVTRVAPDEELDGAVDEILDVLLSLPGDMLRENKRLVLEARENSLAAHLASEAAGIAQFAASPFALARIGALLGTIPAAPVPSPDLTAGD